MHVSDRVINFKKITQPAFDANTQFIYWKNYFDEKVDKNEISNSPKKSYEEGDLTPQTKLSAKHLQNGIGSLFFNSQASRVIQEPDELYNAHDEVTKSHQFSDQ